LNSVQWSAHCFKLAADPGVAEAQDHDAIWFSTGKVIHPKFSEAFRHLTLSAGKSSPDG
jgi:hypothetical protein